MHQSMRHMEDVWPGRPHAPKSAVLRGSRRWRAAAVAAAGWAAAFAVLSLYWALGGRWGAGTIGPAIEDPAVAGDRAFVVVLWASVALKAAGAVVALALLIRWRTRRARIAVLVVAWSTTSLTGGYAVLGTAQHALMAIGVLAVPPGLGVAALRWHLALWDPIWLLGGLLFLLATVGYASAQPIALLATEGEN
jgi:hypothetical protein